MPGYGTHRRFHLFNKTSVLLILSIVSLVLLLFSHFTQSAYGNGPGLDSLPAPFVSPDKLMNCTAVVASSTPGGHGPCGAAHTMDVMGVIMVGAEFGLKASNGTLESTMDDTISSYNFSSAKVTLNDLTSNLVVVGGPGVNQVTWYYNNLWNSSGSRALPAYFDKFPNGTDNIYVPSTNHHYAIQYDSLGRVKADYGLITTLNDHGRQVLILAGLGGSGTWAACKIVSSFESYSLQGGAAIVKYYDSNGDGFLDTLQIVETVPTTINLSNMLEPLPLELFAAATLPRLNSMKKKIFSKRRLLGACIVLIFAVTMQLTLTVYSGDPDAGLFTFTDLSHPFVAAGGLLNTTVIVASSSVGGHGPCGAAHTMDVMGGIMVAAQFGEDATGGSVASTLDDYISTYDIPTGHMTFSPMTTNLLLEGGPGVNQVTWYYNNLRNASWIKVLPVYFDKFPNGTDYIYVPSTGHAYTIQYDALGRVSADYGVVTLYYDSDHGWWVVIAAGLGGPGTEAASRLLATYKDWSLFGESVVVKYYDSNGDGYLDTMSVVEVVGVGKSIDLYWDQACTNVVQSINWGALNPGQSTNVTVFVRNEGADSTILSLNISGWSPLEAANYLTVDWNYSGTPIPSGQTIPIMLTLSVDDSISGVTDFGVNVTVSSS